MTWLILSLALTVRCKMRDSLVAPVTVADWLLTSNSNYWGATSGFHGLPLAVMFQKYHCDFQGEKEIAK
jgi:hypothetical protein